MIFEKPILIRGGGDLASGVAYRLFKSGFHIIITEIPHPMVVRRTVSFAEAVYEGKWVVEGIAAQLVTSAAQAVQSWENGIIPVIIDPDLQRMDLLQPNVHVDARMKKKGNQTELNRLPLVIGLGPGFEVGINCHAFIETQRGHYLGRLYWGGRAAENTGIPGAVMGVSAERIIRSPGCGVFKACVHIGEIVTAGQNIGNVGGSTVLAPIAGLVRGLIHDGIDASENLKIGDIDPRLDPRLCETISDKALAVGGGVLEAILTAKSNNLI